MAVGEQGVDGGSGGGVGGGSGGMCGVGEQSGRGGEEGLGDDCVVGKGGGRAQGVQVERVEVGRGGQGHRQAIGVCCVVAMVVVVWQSRHSGQYMSVRIFMRPVRVIGPPLSLHGPSQPLLLTDNGGRHVNWNRGLTGKQLKTFID